MNTTPTTTTTAPAPSRRVPTRAIIAVSAAAAAIALGVGGFLATTAAFTDQNTVTGNTVSTAELTIGQSASAPVNATNLIPGASAPTDDVLVFTNAGTVDFSYTITLSNIQSDSTALEALTPVTITAGGQTVTGTLASPPTLTSALAPTDSAVDVDVTVGLDAAATNDVKDKTATFDLIVNATQK